MNTPLIVFTLNFAPGIEQNIAGALMRPKTVLADQRLCLAVWSDGNIPFLCPDVQNAVPYARDAFITLNIPSKLRQHLDLAAVFARLGNPDRRHIQALPQFHLRQTVR